MAEIANWDCKLYPYLLGPYKSIKNDRRGAHRAQEYRDYTSKSTSKDAI